MHGFSGLEDQEKMGRSQRLTPGQLLLADQDLRQSPREFGYSQNLWDGKLLAHHLEQTQKVALGVRQCKGSSINWVFGCANRASSSSGQPGRAEGFIKKTRDSAKKRA